MRIGFDIGGTFTDVIALAGESRLKFAKLLSLREGLGERISAFADDAGSLASVERFIHATTTASNAVIEGHTARTGLLTTRGFRDDLEMRGQRRPNIYDIEWDRLPPLVERRLRIEVDERISGQGEILRPLDVAQAREAIRRLLDAGVEAIAVCLVNSYLNPVHEQAIGALIAELAPGLVVCLSSDIDPDIGETDRASTTAINASLVPVFDRYLSALERQLTRQGASLQVMQSNGALLPALSARIKPANLIESGPAAGVLACARLAREAGFDKVLSFDMGGTTAKACLIEHGSPFEKTSGEVGGGMTSGSRLFGAAGHVLRVPWLDIVEVGAGGGSVAWVESGAVMKVGPRSAGAEPGPACYGRGGTSPTLTDANVVLGYINPRAIAGGTIPIDAAAAERVISDHVARPLKLSSFEAAFGITRVANATMMRALRAVSTERGRDPRTFTLVAFGGGGPLHAAAIAETIGIRKICVPLHPGLFSALGLLLADHAQTYTQGMALQIGTADPHVISAAFADLERQARRDMGREDVQIRRQMVVKYRFQMTSLMLDFDDGVTPEDLPAWIARQFEQAHLMNFGHIAHDTVELVSVRLTATVVEPRLQFADLARQARELSPAALETTRPAWFGPDHGLVETPVVGRANITATRAGPVIIEEPDTTVVIPPNWSVWRDDLENLIIERA